MVAGTTANVTTATASSAKCCSAWDRGRSLGPTRSGRRRRSSFAGSEAPAARTARWPRSGFPGHGPAHRRRDAQSGIDCDQLRFDRVHMLQQRPVQSFAAGWRHGRCGSQPRFQRARSPAPACLPAGPLSATSVSGRMVFARLGGERCVALAASQRSAHSAGQSGRWRRRLRGRSTGPACVRAFDGRLMHLARDEVDLEQPGPELPRDQEGPALGQRRRCR